MAAQFISIGKAPDNDWTVELPHVSRYHAVIVIDKKGTHIYDLASMNKTYVNGKPVMYKDIAEGDRVSLGANSSIDIHAAIAAAGKRDTSRKSLKFIRIGTAVDNDWVINNQHVSRHHAILFRLANGENYIVDAGSLNKVYVNGVPVAKSEMQASDRVSLSKQVELPVRELMNDLKHQALSRVNSDVKKDRRGIGRTAIMKMLEGVRAQEEKKMDNLARNAQRNLDYVVQDTNRKIRKIALACVVLVALLSGYVGYREVYSKPQIVQAMENNRDAVVMIVHEFAPMELTFDDHNSVSQKAMESEPLARDTESGRYLYSTQDIGVVEGSGFLYRYQGSPVVITNKHVVEPWGENRTGLSKNITIRMQGETRSYKAEVLAVHPDKDIALLRVIDAVEPWTEVELETDMGIMEAGDAVGCMSFPLGSRGQKDEEIRADLLNGNVINISHDEIKHDIVSAPGASGGPVFNEDGKVVAIIRGGMVDENGRIWQINYALPISYVTDLMK
jgi:pSer/pThr/pTyr-binding forkhead associated (FHA) protein/S1-C subfamily serine protease